MRRNQPAWSRCAALAGQTPNLADTCTHRPSLQVRTKKRCIFETFLSITQFWHGLHPCATYNIPGLTVKRSESRQTSIGQNHADRGTHTTARHNQTAGNSFPVASQLEIVSTFDASTRIASRLCPAGCMCPACVLH